MVETIGSEGDEEDYSASFDDLTGGATALLLNAAEIGTATRLVDVGAGTGLLAAAAIKRGAEVAAVDNSEKMVKLANYNAPDAMIHFADAAVMPIEARWADAVISSFVLHLLKDPVSAVLEGARVLRDGGIFAATVWRRHADNPALGYFFEAARQAGLEVPEASQAGPPLWDPEWFANTLSRARMVAIEVRPIEWILRVRWDRWWTEVKNKSHITGKFIREQDEDTHSRIRRNYRALMAELPNEDEYTFLPARAMLATGIVTHPDDKTS